MRILHLHSGNLYGGVETVLRTMARRRADVPDLQQDFAVCCEGRIAAELREAGAVPHVLGPVHASQPLSIFRARKRIADLCRATHFDATVVHSPWSLALLAPAACRPLILCQHDLAGAGHWTERWSRRTRPNLIIANSDFTAATVPPVYPGVPVVRVRPPVELASRRDSAVHRNRVRGQFQTRPGATVILQASRFETWKGHHLLLDALAALRSRPGWVLWIAGAAQRPSEVLLRDQLYERVCELGIENRVVFLGHSTDMASVMQASDIYCQPNTAPEPFGLAFIEALHAGLPIVSTAIGGANEILHPGRGVLVEPRADVVAAALMGLMASPKLRRRLGEAGPLHARTLCDPRTQMRAFAETIRFCGNSRVAA
jgi:glycosyltransferase involved in cell wall biosynthesis